MILIPFIPSKLAGANKTSVDLMYADNRLTLSNMYACDIRTPANQYSFPSACSTQHFIQLPFGMPVDPELRVINAMSTVPLIPTGLKLAHELVLSLQQAQRNHFKVTQNVCPGPHQKEFPRQLIRYFDHQM